MQVLSLPEAAASLPSTPTPALPPLPRHPCLMQASCLWEMGCGGHAPCSRKGSYVDPHSALGFD